MGRLPMQRDSDGASDPIPPLRRAAGICPAPLHERHSPVLEPNRVTEEESLAARRLSEIIAEVLLCSMSFGDLVLQ